MSPRRRTVFWSVLALFLYGLFYAFLDWGGPAIVHHALLQPHKSELSFEFQACKEGADFDKTGPPVMAWEDARTLRVTVIAEANCGASWFFGDYSVRGNTIGLEYTPIASSYYMCDCEHQVTYRIRDLPKKNYRLEVTAQPEVYTAWMGPALIAGTALVAVLLGLAYGVAFLLARRSGRSKTVTLLAILLAFSGATNLLLVYLMGSEMQSTQMNAVVSDGNLKYLGQTAGRERADRDFASGVPRWFVMEESEGVPTNVPGRPLVVMEGGGWKGFVVYRRAYVESYNLRMDKHVPRLPKPPAPGGVARK